MHAFQETLIHVDNVRSLCWDGGTLVDWVGGGNRFKLDGTTQPRHVQYSYRFDHGVVSPSGRYAAIVEQHGTKGLLLDQGTIIREINRSFYHSNVYDYPIALFTLPDGREVIAHCPDQYNRIEVEEIATGRRLTASSSRQPKDFFHSRLVANRAGTYLLSAGWVWHPWDAVVFFDVVASLNDPTLLDRVDFSPAFSRCVCLAEESTACFQDDEHVLIASSAEPEDEEEARSAPEPRLLPCSIACYGLSSRAYLWNTRLKTPAGVLMPVGTEYAITFYQHPKLIHLNTGAVLHSWQNLATGEQFSSINSQNKPLPPLALDPVHNRFAVAQDRVITVVEIDPTGL